MAAQPLSGLRVVEAGASVAVACCGQQFAQWGAEVLVLEPSEGSGLRRSGPMWRRGEARGSVLFDAVMAGKRSAVVRSPEAAAATLDAADLVLTDGDLARLLACSPQDLRRGRPALVAVSITPFGLTGPRSGEAAGIARLEALSGYLSLNGPAMGAPTAAPAHLLEHTAGVSAFVGALAALIRRQSMGSGDLVDVSILETVAGLLPFLREQHQGGASPRLGGTVEGARLLKCRDGWVSVAPAIPSQFSSYRAVLDVPEATAPNALLEGGRGLAADRVIAALAPFAARKAAHEICAGLQVHGVACGVVQSPQAVLRDAQLAALDFFATVPHPVLGHLPLAGRAAHLTGASSWSPSAAPRAPGPARARWKGRRETPAPPSRPTSAPPLAGLRVLDLTQAWIGPLAGMILGDLGAEVMKVEAPHRPDIWRSLGQAPEDPRIPSTDPVNRSWYFNAVNRNKRGLGLDLGRPEGAAAFLRLAAGADVVLENFTPRVMSRFGLDYQALLGARRDLIVTSFSGFGPVGPRAEAKANGAAIEAFAGWDALHADEAGEPVLMGAYPADPICGLQMAACTLVALYRRNRTGRGGHVQGAMLAAAAGGVGEALLAEAMARAGAEVAPAARPRVTRQAGDGAWQVSDAQGETTAIRSTLEALDDQQLRARGWFLALEAPGLGTSWHNGAFWRFAESGAPVPRSPPKLGEHSREVLAEAIGPDRAEALFAAGIAGGRP